MNIFGLSIQNGAMRYFGFKDDNNDFIIRPDIVVTEKHIDSSMITSHPIQSGATISDHVFDNSAELTVEMVFSSGGSLIDVFDTTESLNLGIGKTSQEIYQEILELKALKELLTVSTGKRLYENMLMRTVTVETDQESEYILSIIIDFVQVSITNSQTDFILAPVKFQKLRNNTDGITNIGHVQTGEISNNTYLKDLLNLLM